LPRGVARLIYDDMRARRRIEAQGAECVHVAPIVELNFDDGGCASVAGFLDVNHSRLADLDVECLVGPLDLTHQKEREDRPDAYCGCDKGDETPGAIPPDQSIELACFLLRQAHASLCLRSKQSRSPIYP